MRKWILLSVILLCLLIGGLFGLRYLRKNGGDPAVKPEGHEITSISYGAGGMSMDSIERYTAWIRDGKYHYEWTNFDGSELRDHERNLKESEWQGLLDLVRDHDALKEEETETDPAIEVLDGDSSSLQIRYADEPLEYHEPDVTFEELQEIVEYMRNLAH